MTSERSILIVGAGMFGLTAALELRRRGWRVTLLDPGPIPRDTAASTDISKVVRPDYGADELYTALGEASISGWHEWNHQWGEALYHEDGFLVLRRDAMTPGSFEFESFMLLQKRGWNLRRFARVENAGGRGSTRARTSPAEKWAGVEPCPPDDTVWAGSIYTDGYLNPRAGWVESGKVVARLASGARANGVEIKENAALHHLIESGSRVVGIATDDGAEHRADCVLVAAGAWTPTLLPHLSDVMWATAQPVLHFRAPNLRDFTAPRFPVWAADISRTGWYGFPALPDGTLKIANHGSGRRVHPDEPRAVWTGEVERFRAFLRDAIPALADAPLLASHTCLYCDTFDGAFWIDHDPQRPGLVVAAGDSGHAFKFAPVMGGLIADAVERKENLTTSRFAWRARADVGREGARAK